MIGPGEGRPGGAAIGLVAIALLVVVAATFLVLHLRDLGVVSARAEAASAAEDAVPALLSYDHRTLESDIDGKSGQLTGTFKDEYTNLLRTVVLPAAQQSKLITTTQVQSTGVMSDDGADRITMLVFVDQSTGTEGQAPNTAGSRVRVTMEKPADTWLVSELTPV